MVVLLNASGTGHQWSFSFKDLSVTYWNARAQEDEITKIKCCVFKVIVNFVGGAFSLDTSLNKKVLSFLFSEAKLDLSGKRRVWGKQGILSQEPATGTPESIRVNEARHEISNNVVCATSKGSDQPAHTRSLIRAFASCLNILWLLSSWPNSIWSF